MRGEWVSANCDHYEDQGLFHRLMDRVRGIVPGGDGFLPVLKTALT